MSHRTAKVCPKCGARYDAGAEFCQLDGALLENTDPYIGRTLLDQFVIEEVLGSGGMGSVYRARQLSVERDVAIKILHPELATNPDAVRRFRREARVSSELEHPNIVRVYLFGQLPGEDSLYLVMQYLDGHPLSDVVRREGALELTRALHIATQVCDGIGDAHAHGVVHRDVKPENVLLIQRAGDPDFVKVLDFGIARFLEGEQTVATQSGLIFGTARYISPEGASGEPTDARSDVYSIAVLAYQLLSGRTPFDSKSPVSLLMKHLHEPAPQLGSLPGCDHIPRAVVDVVMRSLNKRPAARPVDANELGTALREAAHIAGLDELAPAMFRRSAPSTGGGARRRSLVSTRQNTAPTDPISHGGSHNTAHPTDSFSDPAPSLSFLTPPGSGALRTLAIAFIVGAVAVAVGAWVYGGPWLDTTQSRIETLEHEARAALARGDLDAPESANVRELTDRLLELDSSYRPALSMRREAGRRLREEASTARAQGFVDEATGLLRRALTFNPDDHAAAEALARLSEPPAEPKTVPTSLVLLVNDSPAGGRARVGDRVRFVATTEASLEAAEFVVRSGRRTLRRLPANRADDGHRWEAGYRFRSPARYVVALEAADFEGTLESAVTVRRASSGDTPTVVHAPAPRPPPTVMAPAPVPPADDGIDWGIPGSTRQAPPPMISRPPADDEHRTPTPMVETPPSPEPNAPPAPWSSGG